MSASRSLSPAAPFERVERVPLDAEEQAVFNRKLLVLVLATHNGYWREMDGCVGLCRDTAYDTAREDGLLALTVHYAAKAAREANAAYTGRREFGMGPPHQWTRLHYAARAGLAGRVSVLLAAGADVNALDTRRSSALYYASLCNRLEVVAALLACPGIVVRSAPGNERTAPLLIASYFGHSDVITALLAFPGIDVNDDEQYGRTAALYCAASHGHTASVSALLACGVHVNKLYLGDSSLAIACEGGHLDTVRAFLGCPGIDVNSGRGPSPIGRRTRLDIGRRTPLFAAAVTGRVEIVKLLLAVSGVDVNERVFYSVLGGSRRYMTVRHVASVKGHTAIAELLRAAGGVE